MRVIAPAVLHVLHSQRLIRPPPQPRYLHSRPVEASLDAAASSLSMDVSIQSAGSVKVDAVGGSSYASPKELLYSSLCTCTLATLETFIANSKKSSSSWMAAGSDLIRSVEAIEAMDEAIDGHIPVSVELLIKLRGGNELTSEQRDRLLVAAAFCPVKRMLSPAIKIRTSIV